MNRRNLIQLLFCALLGVCVSGCGSRAPRLEPPRARLASLEVDAATREFIVRFRLSNPAARQLPLDAVNLNLTVDGQNLAPLTPEFAGDIPALGEELLRVEGTFSPAAIDVLRQLAEGQRSQLPMQIAGQVRHSGDQTFEVDDAGWLSPTPGRPWHFR